MTRVYRKYKTVVSMFVMAALVVAMAFKPVSKGRLVIHFANYAGNEKLVLDSATYKNNLGQPFTVSMFKYYISTIRLINNNGEVYNCKDGYFLVNEDDSSSKQIILNEVPEGKYTSISFMIGVDSLHNCSGAQAGALDPANGMFWAWNTGYIFLKLEGRSPLSKSNGNELAFHIGGYKQPYNCIRTVILNSNIAVAANQNTDITIKADVLELFKTPVNIDFSKLSSVTDFHNAVTIANNYTDMFSIKP